MVSTCINSPCALALGSGMVMPGSGVLVGALDLVDRTPFLAWVRWPWRDHTETGQYFEALA